MHIRWRGLELPSHSDVRQGFPDAAPTASSSPSRSSAASASTIGNSLRRILLSSLEGSAVTQIKMHGAQHEFTTMPGVVEDVTDIVLNVKSLVVKNHSDSTRVHPRREEHRRRRSPAPTSRPTRRSRSSTRTTSSPR